MSVDGALALFVGAIRATVFIAGPILAVSLVAGVLVGLIQAATQVNEASVSYVVKVAAVIGVVLVTGHALADQAVAYARNTLGSIERVVQ